MDTTTFHLLEVAITPLVIIFCMVLEVIFRPDNK